MSRWTSRAATFLLAVGAAVAVPATTATAHPLGNFTINTYSGLRIAPDRISVDFLVDMAEIPALQRKGESAQPGYARRECDRLAGDLDLRLDGGRLDLRLDAGDVAFPEGQGGLETLGLACALSAPVPELGGEHAVSFSSRSYTDRVGWREISAVGDGVTIVTSDVPERSISERLTRYPQDLLASPVDRRTADVIIRPGGPAAAISPPTSPLPAGVDRVTRAFTSFVSHRNLTIGFALVAVVASVVLGALHALAPGHGKTVMAAYLVGQRGSFRQAAAIALTVTATHTAGVLALGLAISASAVVAPERVYPWLGTASGLLLALVGVGIFVRLGRRRRAGGHDHDHRHGDHDHSDHDHGGHSHGRHGGHSHGGHSHGGRHHSHGPLPDDHLVTWRGLLAMGFAGGLLPSPSAVVVLLGATALGRAWFGGLLVLAYGIGMAATLIGIGLLLLRARRALDRRVRALHHNRLLLATSRLLPGFTAGVIVAAGVYLLARGAAQI